MDTSLTTKARPIAMGLTLVCLVLQILTLMINLFFSYEGQLSGDNLVYTLITITPSLRQIFSALRSLAPAVLFLIFLLTYPKGKKTHICVFLSLALISLNFLINFISLCIRSVDGFVSAIAYSLASLLPAILFALAACTALKGLGSKILIYIPCALISVFYLLVLAMVPITYRHAAEHGQVLYIISAATSMLSPVFLYAALALFTSKNRIPPILPLDPEKEKQVIAKMPAKKALLRLTEDLQLGLFTQEEYQQLRESIIEQL